MDDSNSTPSPYINNSLAINGTSTYVFTPVHYSIKFAIAFAYFLTGVFSLVAHSLILYYKTNAPIQARSTWISSRRSVIERFIQSLSITDILSSLTSIPVLTAEMFIDYIQSDLLCKISRYIVLYCPIATIMNYFVIGLERYLGIFYPLYLPSNRVVTKLVLLAWLVAAGAVLLTMPAYNLVYFDLANNFYTRVCRYDNTVKAKRISFLSFTVIAYIIPSVSLTTMNIRILQFLRRRRRALPTSNPLARAASTSKYKATSMFVTLIFALVIPYMFFMLYSGISMVLKLKVSFTLDIVRYLSSFLSYSNSAIGAIIMFYNSSHLRRSLKQLCRSVFCCETDSRRVSDVQGRRSRRGAEIFVDNSVQMNVINTKVIIENPAL